MTEFDITVDIAAAPDRVWSVMRDIERWSEWTPSVTSIQRLDSGPLRAGSEAVVRQPKLPPAKWRITGIDDARRSFTWVSVAPGVRVVASHGVEPAPGGSRATLSIRYTGALGPLLGWLTGSLNDRYLKLEAQGLKSRSEAGGPRPA
jgi:uncharacterized membrane protein